MIIEKIKDMLWEFCSKRYKKKIVLGIAYILFILFGSINICQSQLPIHDNWKADSPELYKVEIFDGDKKISTEVKMQYYLSTTKHRYYKKAKGKGKNNKFGENFDIDSDSKFKVTIEFKKSKNVSSSDIRLLISGSGWINSTGCFENHPSMQSSKKSPTKNYPFEVHYGGGIDLIFDLKPNCDKLSNITIDFGFKNSKTKKDLTFKASSSNAKRVTKKTKQLPSKSTSVNIPIKVKPSVQKDLSIAQANTAERKAAEAADAAKAFANTAAHAASLVEDALKEASSANTVEAAVTAIEKAIKERDNADTAAGLAESHLEKAKNAVKEATTAASKAKSKETKTTAEGSVNIAKEKAKEAKQYAENARTSANDAVNKAEKAGEAKEAIISNASWLKEIEDKISNQDLLKQVSSLESRMFNEDNANKRKLLKNTVIGKVETFFRETVLTRDPCDIEFLKGFEDSHNYKDYLDSNKKQTFQDHKATCGSTTTTTTVTTVKTTKRPQSDSEGFAAAKTTNTIKAYEIYIKKFPKGEKVGKAKREIKAIKKKDKDAWEKAIAAKTDNACSNVGVFETYLKDTKHHTEYRIEAEKERKKASKKCTDFRIESKTQNGPEGIYTFEIKEGNPPFKVAPINNDGAVLNIENEIITLLILKKGDYKIQITDSEGDITVYALEAQHPDLKILDRGENLIIAGGQSPFDLFEEESKRSHQLNGRSIKKEVLISKLGIQENFYLQAIGQNNVTSNKIFIKTNDEGGGIGLLGWTLLLAIILTSSFFLFKNKIPFLKDLQTPSKINKEDAFWKRAEEIKTLEYYSLYKKQYPEGKYIEQTLAREKEIKEWEACKTKVELADYLHKYSSSNPLFKEEALSKLNEPATASAGGQQSADSKAGQPTPSNIDFYAGEQETTNSQSSNAVPLALSTDEYFKFDLNEHWDNSMVQSIWMSRDACLEAYYLIEDANKLAFQQDEVIPEVGGFLLGTAQATSNASFDLQIEKFVSVTPENNGEYEVSFGQKAFMELSDAYDANPGLKLMGWMHTHPGHGLFLSAKDLVVVNQFFKERYQVSMEVDTKTRNLDTAFFSRKNNNELNNTTSDKKPADWFHWEDVKYWLKTKSDSINK